MGSYPISPNVLVYCVTCVVLDRPSDEDHHGPIAYIVYVEIPRTLTACCDQLGSHLPRIDQDGVGLVTVSASHGDCR